MHELRGPRRFEAPGYSDMLGDGREAQGALAGWPDRAARFENFGLAASVLVEKCQLNRDDFARRRFAAITQAPLHRIEFRRNGPKVTSTDSRP